MNRIQRENRAALLNKKNTIDLSDLANDQIINDINANEVKISEPIINDIKESEIENKEVIETPKNNKSDNEEVQQVDKPKGKRGRSKKAE